MVQIEDQFNARAQRTLPASAAQLWAASRMAWPFIYIFFTNGIPFDAPNRSEPCPPA